jgi:hypothetical protein
MTLGLLGAAGALLQAGEAVDTRIVVRAVSKGAKIIGDGVGGARITIRDAASGDVLATGIQRGGSGDTRRIMGLQREPGAPIYDTPGAASFEATLRLDGPTTVEVTAEGPLDYPQSTEEASKTLLLLPGQDVVGDGLILEIHGYALRVLAPEDGAEVQAGQPLEVRATVRMA